MKIYHGFIILVIKIFYGFKKIIIMFVWDPKNHTTDSAMGSDPALRTNYANITSHLKSLVCNSQ